MHDLTFSRLYNRLTDNVDKSRLRVTMCFRGSNTILRSVHHNITKEVCIMCLRIIITLISNNSVPIIDQRTTSTKVIGHL